MLCIPDVETAPHRMVARLWTGTILYWTALGLDFLAPQYCHGLNCAIGASARAARANETLAIGGALFLLRAAGVLVAAMRRARRMRS